LIRTCGMHDLASEDFEVGLHCKCGFPSPSSSMADVFREKDQMARRDVGY
jgi:hypothetical protein